MTRSLLGLLRFENPVLSKDLRTRMRGTKAFLVQGFYVGVLVLVMGIMYLTWWASHRAGASPVTVSSDLGRVVYLLIFEIQAALVALITPALTAGTITIEHEQRTYEMLACTRLAPRTILTGKLLSGWLFVVMLLTCSLPLAALCLMFGGVSGAEIFWAYVMLCCSALFFGSVGVFFSALMSRSMGAVMLTYGAVGAYLILTAITDPRYSGMLWPLNAFAFIVDPIEPIQFFSTKLPGWLPAVVILPLASLLLLNWGISRLRHFAADRAIAVRWLTAVLFVALTFFGLGRAMSGSAPRWWGPGMPTAPIPGTPHFVVAMAAAAVLLFLAVFFVTGDRPGGRFRSLVGWMITGLDPRRMFSNQLRGGWAYLLLLTAALAAALKYGASLSAVDALATFALIGAVMLACSALGALSAALNSRAAGVALIVLMLLLTQTVPAAMWLHYGSMQPRGNGADLVHYALYVAPWWPLSLIHRPVLEKYFPPLLLPPAAPPVWLVTTVLYLLMAAVGFGLAEMAYQLYLRRGPMTPMKQNAQVETGA